MNSITFDGRLAADAELRFTPSGEPVLSFRVASDIGFGDRKTTNWFACTIFGKRAEALKDYLTKGQQVTVYGQLTLREWQDKDGGKRTSPDVRVNELSMQGGKRDDDQPCQQGGNGYARESGRGEPAPPRRQEQRQAPPPDDLDSDIPFF